MNNFTFYSPTYFVFGKETENQTGKYVKKFGGSNVLIHFGEGSAIKNGVVDRICKSLENCDIKLTLLGGVKPNPRSDLVYEGIKICKKNNIDFVLAIGGGSAIDSAKAIALGALYDGDFWDFYTGRAVVANAIPIGTILTIAAAGSEGSGDSVITHNEGMLKRATGGDALRPAFSILNPQLTTTLPKYQIACGIADIMAHVFERYFTNTENCEVTTSLCESILRTIMKEAPEALSKDDNYDSMANIMWAGMVAHNNLLGVGRAQDWASHIIEHELSAFYDVAHGAGLAVVFPAWMKYVYKHNIKVFERFATNVFDIIVDSNNPQAAVSESINKLSNFWKSIGLPSNFDELGAKKEDIRFLVDNLELGQNLPIGAFLKLNKDDIESIYSLCL